MKKLFAFILVLLVFAIGCSNTDPIDPIDPIDPNAPMPTGSPVYGKIPIPGIEDTDKEYANANNALNEGVERLGNLNGYAQFYYVSEGNTTEKYRAIKLFIKGDTVKTSEVKKVTTTTTTPTAAVSHIQIVTEYSLGGAVTNFKLDYYTLVNKVPQYKKEVPEADYNGYEVYYDATIKNWEEKRVDKDSTYVKWETIYHMIGEKDSRLIKNTSTEFNVNTGFDNVIKASSDSTKYGLIISETPPPTPVFSKEIMTFKEFVGDREP